MAVQSLLHLPLIERQQELELAIAPADEGKPLNESTPKGRIINLLPGCSMPSGRTGSALCTTVEEAEALAQEHCDAQASLRVTVGGAAASTACKQHLRLG